MTWAPDPSIIITAEMKTSRELNAAWAALRIERDRLFEETRWLVERHSEELLLGRMPTLSASQYTDLLAYRQDLRDLPGNTVDPEQVVWPAKPAM